jgi:hypothetical protein
MIDQEERPVPTVLSRRAGVVSDERWAECMASGTLRFDGAVVIDRPTRAPPGTGIVAGGAWGSRCTAHEHRVRYRRPWRTARKLDRPSVSSEADGGLSSPAPC